MEPGDAGTILRLFLAFLLLSAAAFIIAWIRGRQWGDLSSRQHCGEALTEEEKAALRRSRRGFLVWGGISFVAAALSFFALYRG